MTDTTTTAPRAGWYADPSAAAAYRWWDGAQWTAQTLDAAPTASAPTPAPASTPASAEVEEHAAAEREAAERAATQRATTQPRPQSPALPSRRSLRNLPSVAVGTPPAGSVEPTVAAPAAAASSPYVPLNPLATTATPPASPSDGWHTPAAWIANAPASPEHAVYGTGSPFGASRPGAFTLQPRNKPARLALTFMLITLITDGVSIALTTQRLLTSPIAVLAQLGVGVVVIGLVIAAVPLSIVGLVRASQMKSSGLTPVGRPHAVAALILALLFLALFGLALSVGVLAGLERAGSHTTTSSTTGAGTGTSAIAHSATGAPTPVIGTPQADGTLLYSQAQAQAALTAAIKGDTSIAATVGCPATVALSVGASFECRVTLPGGTATAHVSVLDSTGRSEIQISTP